MESSTVSENPRSSKGRPARNVPRISFAEEVKLPRPPKVAPKLKKKPAISNSKKRKSDEVSVVLESDNDTKKIRIAEGGMQETVLWKNLKDQKQDELEEQLIARAFKKSSNTATNRAKVDTHPREFPTQQAAQAYCLSNPSQIADLSQPEAEMVGHLAKVFWDGEDTWFYARVLNFNSITGEYFVRHLFVVLHQQLI